jgi:hypothetical protein
MGHFEEGGRRSYQVVYVFHIVEVSDSKFLQKFGDLMLSGSLEKIEIFVLRPVNFTRGLVLLCIFYVF